MDWNTEKDKLRSEIKCNLCEEIFEKFNDLEKHIEKTHDNPKTRRKVMDRNTERGKVRSEVKCNSCEEIFDKCNDLEKHIKTKNDNPKTFHCEQCDKELVRASLCRRRSGHYNRLYFLLLSLSLLSSTKSP